jgi:hypothetical protein
MTKYKLTTKNFETEIKDIVLPSIFPNMNKTHQHILIDYVIKLINIIALCFCFDIENKQDVYLDQFKQNNYQDVKWLITHLLPYINDENNPKNITSFDDIYNNKKKNTNINTEEPSYLYSNIQYNRFVRDKNNYQEYNFKIQDINHNYYLLVDSIRNCSNKLCANWINLVPHTMISYQKTKLYEDTIKNFYHKKISDWDPVIDTNVNLSNNELCNDLNQKINGLYIGHIYEEIADLYYSIKDYKWILFDIFINYELVPMTDFILYILGDENELPLQYSNWDELNDIQQYFFHKKMNKINIMLETNKYDYKTPETTIKSFVRSFIFFFERSVISDEASREGYITIEKYKQNDDDLSDDDDDSKLIFKDDLSDEILVASFLSLNPKFIFNYIAETLQKLKITWYGYLLLSDDKTKINDFEHSESVKLKIKQKPLHMKFTKSDTEILIKKTDNNENLHNDIDNFNNSINKKEGIYLSFQPKNIYNYAKSLCHNMNNNKVSPFPKKWCSLTESQKSTIIKRINGDDELNPLDWFRINRYIKRVYFYKKYETDSYPYIKNLSDKGKQFNLKIQMTNLMIYQVIGRLIIDIIFQSLIHKGILTQFIPDKERSDKSYLDGNVENIIKKKIPLEKQRKIFEQNDNNEFWTGSYHYLTSKRYKDMNIEKYEITDDKKKFNYFSFGLKIPWYTAGAYDWIGQIGFCHRFINNRVIFITGGTGVGKSTEIPKLFMYYSRVIDGILAPKVVCTQPRKNAVKGNTERVSNTSGVPVWQDEKKSNNYYIQYKYQGDKHHKKVHHPSLMFITGDSLMLELNDPLLKKKSKDGYLSTNQYDIIMIDEAHEHKTHMDILLTFLKLPISINNSLKLVIVSATMEDDEPRYRRFFRDINDNRKFPLNTWLEMQKIDRINVDRRCHIAVPGLGTRYNINENYRPLLNEMDTNNAINEIVQEILKKSPAGEDILIFQPGLKEIIETVELLNKTTPQNILVLPYYSTGLSEDKRIFVGGIGNPQNRNAIKMDKSESFSLIKDYTLGNNSYDRFIIVATNVAEASITIKTLKFVIDTGTEKTNIYDYMKRSDKLIKSYISESSRRQRKGRVGRTSSGEVYYLYEKGKMTNNKISYEFATMNIYNILYRYLRKENENNNIFFLSQYDLNESKTINKDQFQKNISTKKTDNKELKSIKKIIENQYFINNNYFTYYGNDDSYDYDNYSKCADYFKTGLNACTLTDNVGDFYIIHPEELKLKRNINGDIVGVKNVEYENELLFVKKLNDKYKGYINSQKIESFWKILYDYMYVTIKKINLHETDCIKTQMGDFFMENSEIFEIFNHNLFRTIIFGMANKYDNIINLCALLDVINFDITKLFVKSIDKKSMMPMVYNKFGSNNSSDGVFLLKIIEEIHTILIKNKILGDSFSINNYVSLSDLYDEKINNLNISDCIEIMGSENKRSKNLNNKIDMLNIDEYKNKLGKIILKNISKKIKYLPDIKIWCSNNMVEYDIILKYLHNYFILYFNYVKIKNNDKLMKYIDNIGNYFFKFSNYDKMNISLLFGFPQNIAVYLEKKYISLYSINDQNIFRIGFFTPQKLKTFVDERHSKGYILYLSNNIDKNEISLIFKLDIKEIILLPHIYNYSLNINFDKKKYIDDNIAKYNKFINEDKTKKNKYLEEYMGTNINNIIINYKRDLKNVMRDFENYKIDISNNLFFIESIEPNMTYYIKIIKNKLLNN